MKIKEIRTKIISVPFLDPPKISFLPPSNNRFANS